MIKQSTLASHTTQSTDATWEKAAGVIHNLAAWLGNAKSMPEIISVAISAISGYFCCDTLFLCFQENGKPRPAFLKQTFMGGQAEQKTKNIPEMRIQRKKAKPGFHPGIIADGFLDWPIYGSENILGMIGLPIETAKTLGEAQLRLLDSIAMITTLAMDRCRAEEQRIKSRAEIVTERSRANLLRAISHDIRTPISGIIGTAEMILRMTKPKDPRYDLVCGIQKDADWLHSLVENILTLTRLQDGKLSLQKQPEAVEEVIGEAIYHIARLAPEHEIAVSVPEELLLVPMDAKLIVQVIMNLLENAIKHTPPGQEISVMAQLDERGRAVRFTIKDSGNGVSEQDLPNIFKLFYTKDIAHEGMESNTGLGLAICESIVKAHGGSIEAHNRKDGTGLEVVFTLPMGDDEYDQV